VAAHDIGRAINPQLLEGQIHGGPTQGVGWTLMEEMVLEDEKLSNQTS
jgi:CO/xanthine dehydrogenase Mo-binding subunit